MIGYRKYARGHFIPWHALFLAMERVTNSKAYMRVVFLTDVGIKGEAQVAGKFYTYSWNNAEGCCFIT
jgi:hypothetical protein